MGLKKLVEKVADYNRRLERGTATKIKPDHVAKVLDKLRRKLADLEAETATTTSANRLARLAEKREIASRQIARAEWLLQEITTPKTP